MITSDKNQIVKDILKLKTKKERNRTGLFYIEGKRFVDEIPEYLKVEKYIFSETFFSSMEDVKYKGVENIVVSNDIFKKISDTSNPQGIMAICNMLNYTLDNIDLNKNKYFIILDRITDPGNLGTIIRTAEALGFDGIFLSKGCVDLYNPKVLRATMGSIFHLPILEECELNEIICTLQKNKVKIVCTHLAGENTPFNVDISNSIAILIGNEANGVLEEYAQKCDVLVKIPMLGKVESLNASISASILFYEVLRQRLNN